MAVDILITGEGLLADHVRELLSIHYRVGQLSLFTEAPKQTKLVLVLHDAWHPAIHQEAEEKFRTAGIPWLRGGILFGEGIVGPLVLPETPGCSRCADTRLILAGSDRQEMAELQGRLAVDEGLRRDAWGSRIGLAHLANLISENVQKILQEEQNTLEGRVFITNFQTLTSFIHAFSPDPLCPICSTLPDDSMPQAKITIHPSPKISTEGYRSRSLDQLKSVLDDLDMRTGIMNGKMLDSSLPFADVYVNLPMFDGNEGVAGRSNSYELSELTAILEGLERYCGIQPQGKKTVVRDSYNHLQNVALDPARVGLHEEKHYAKHDFPFKRFHPDETMNWVWGYSFLQERPILVPELLAYYSLGNGDGFVYETSNGCAIGGSLAEAIFHGIMEVVERDSFLITWYAELRLPRLDPHSAKDRELRLMVDRVREVAGYELYFYNSTMEHGIPSVWAIAKNRNSQGLNLICAAGANPDPIRAMKSSIYELAGMMHGHGEKLAEDPEKYKRMLHDPFEVKTMEDHGLLYGLPETEERLDFLLDANRTLRTFAAEFSEPPKNMDLKDDLEEILKRFRQLQLEVIVIDQSSPVTKKHGLFCVKVLIPGMLPMTFGHHLKRVRGLERVLNVPLKLGFTNQPLTYEQLNPFPHPFP